MARFDCRRQTRYRKRATHQSLLQHCQIPMHFQLNRFQLYRFQLYPTQSRHSLENIR